MLLLLPYRIANLVIIVTRLAILKDKQYQVEETVPTSTGLIGTRNPSDLIWSDLIWYKTSYSCPDKKPRSVCRSWVLVVYRSSIWQPAHAGRVCSASDRQMEEFLVDRCWLTTAYRLTLAEPVSWDNIKLTRFSSLEQLNPVFSPLCKKRDYTPAPEQGTIPLLQSNMQR